MSCKLKLEVVSSNDKLELEYSLVSSNKSDVAIYFLNVTVFYS